MGVTKLDYDKAIRQAQRLQQTADECQQLADAAARRVGAPLASAWLGRSGNTVQSKTAAWAKEMRSIAAGLRETANGIRRTANEIRQRDEALARAALRIGSALGGGSGAFGGGVTGSGSSGGSGGGTR